MFKNIYIIISALVLVSGVLGAQNVTPSSNQNYIMTQAPQVPKTTLGNNNASGEVITSITYYDGLGRPMQSVGVGQSATGKDIVTPVAYDLLGRATKSYLPYATTQSNGAYRSNAVNEVGSFYNTAAYGYSTQPYSESILEASPLNRPIAASHPGKSSDGWTTGGSHVDRMDYASNEANEVKKYVVGGTAASPTLSISGHYPANSLTVSITKNANWTSGDDNTTRTYTNKSGQVVLTRTFDAGVAHDTYNVYDDYGNLTFVLNPVASDATTITAAVLNANVYQYKYDDPLNRMTAKKIPGKGWEEYVYDRLNRIVFTRDANLTSDGNWMVTKYDALDRVAYTGLYTSSSSRASLQSSMNTQSAHNVSISGLTWSNNGTTIYYTNDVWPTNNLTVQSIQYYDIYTPEAPAVTAATSGYNDVVAINVKGLPTVSRTNILGTTDWTTSVSYYDEYGRPLHSYETNLTGGHTYVFQDIDFPGKPIEMKTVHQKTATAAATTVIQDYTYDHAARMLTETMKINNGTEELINMNEYDELGQLKALNMGNTALAPLQTVDYKYNVRGWLTDINDIDATTGFINTDLFNMQLRYTGQWNGNITSTTFKTNSLTKEKQNYVYDALSRLQSVATESIVPNPWMGIMTYYDRYKTNYTYDKIGNLLELERRGQISGSMYNKIDDMTYNYTNGLLASLSESSNKQKGFRSKTTSGIGSYTYDANGNMTRDNHKELTVSYNQLNLPSQFSIDDEGDIDIFYDAAGRKHKKTTTAGVIQEYMGMFEYKNGTLDAIYHSAGRAVKTGSSFTYEYNIKDHLGNTRVTFRKGSTGQAVLIDEHHYYAFGMEMDGFDGGVGSDNQYLYNGKELNTDFGLDWLDYGARWYDSSIARFHTIDPLAENYSFQNPFAYAANNPIKFIDYMGMGPGDPPKIISRHEWGARAPVLLEKNRQYEKIKGNLSDYYDGIVIHHSGNQDSYPTMKDVQDEHIDGKAEKADIGYHFGIDHEGNIYEGRPIDRKGAHVDKANTGKIGIVLLGDFDTTDSGLSFLQNLFEFSDDELTPEMKKALGNLVSYLSDEYGIQSIGGHNEVNCGTRACPGDEGQKAVDEVRSETGCSGPECATGN